MILLEIKLKCWIKRAVSNIAIASNSVALDTSGPYASFDMVSSRPGAIFSTLWCEMDFGIGLKTSGTSREVKAS